MFKKFCFLFLTMAVSICIGVTTANADLVVFDTTGGTTYIGLFPSVGTAYSGQKAWAGGFTVSSSVSVTEIDLEISSRFEASASYSPAFTLEIWESSANLPSNKLWTSAEQTANAVYPDTLTGFNPMTALQSISVTGPTLTAGSYLLVVRASQPTSDIDWWESSIVGTTDQLLNDGTTWSVYSVQTGEPAFKIVGEATPVPIPAAVWLLGSGLIGLIGIRRFRK